MTQSPLNTLLLLFCFGFVFIFKKCNRAFFLPRKRSALTRMRIPQALSAHPHENQHVQVGCFRIARFCIESSQVRIIGIIITMLFKSLVFVVLAAFVAASPPISSPSLPQRLTAIQGEVSLSECVPCEEAMGTAIHTAAESGSFVEGFPFDTPHSF
jgi:hypothetical protein